MWRLEIMPNAFQFIDKSTRQAEKFSIIDDKLREFLGKPPDSKSYYRSWYDGFGFCAAMGDSFQKMKETTYKEAYEDASDPEVKKMLDWLDEHYEVNALGYMPKC